MNNADTILHLDEVSKHKTRGDLWIILYDKVYDVTSILPQHPGGKNIILDYVAHSQDLTAPFEETQHSSKARNTMSDFCVGSLRNNKKNKKNKNAKTLFSKIEASKPSESDLMQNIWEYTPSKSVEMQNVAHYGTKRIIGWGDLFSVKIEMLDNQHENIVNIMNKIFNFGKISDLNEFIAAWNIHCETEQYLFDIYNFGSYQKKLHIKDHTRIINMVNDTYDDLLRKYEHKFNLNQNMDASECKKDDTKREEFECEELSTFVKKRMVPEFKKHAFEFDSLYIDQLGDKDPSIYVKWEKSSQFNLMKPIFPNDDQINLAIFQDAVYGNNQLMLQLQTNAQEN